MTYARRTLNCGHLDLIEQSWADERGDTVGTLTACYVCPMTRDEDAGSVLDPATGLRRGRCVSSLRFVVKIERDIAGIDFDWPSEWWYGGRG